MIERKDILPIPYLKKADFNGSYQGMRFRFHRGEREEEAGAEEGKKGDLKNVRQVLEVTAWEGPYCFDATPEEERQKTEVDFSEEGIMRGIGWLNGLWEADPGRWKKAKGNW